MIKTLYEPKILEIVENLDLKKLIAEAVSTWSKKLPAEIELELEGEEFDKRKRTILDAVKDGYSSILEMPVFHIQAILPRLATLALVSFSPGSNFLQQSLRYTIPMIKEEGEKMTYIFLPESFKNKEVKINKHVEKGIKLYMDLIEDINVLKTRKPEEDARYHLPLCIGTFISASINLSHVTYMLRLLKEHQLKNMPVIDPWKKFIEKVVENSKLGNLAKEVAEHIKLGKFYPIAYPFISNKIMKKISMDFEKNNKNEVKLLSYSLGHLSIFSKEEIRRIIREGINEGSFNDFSDIIFEFAVKESVIARHQIIRHRTIQQESISIYDAAERGELIIPSSIKQSNLITRYEEYIKESLSLYEELKNEDEDNAVLMLPSNIVFITKLRLDGYNIFNFRGFLGNRCCELAQAETQLIASMINNKVKEVFEKEGYKELTYILHANCFKLRRCPELIERAINCSIFKSRSFERELFN